MEALALSAEVVPTAVPPAGGPAAAVDPARLAAPAEPGLRPAELMRGVGGWVVYAAVSLAGDAGHLGGGVLHTLAAPTGALLLTVPALLVGHQFLDLRSPPGALVSALLRGFCRAGDVALGLSPLALLFSATSDIAPYLLVLGLLGTSFQTLLLSMKRLQRAEAAESPGDWSRQARMSALVLGWAGLCGLIGLRLAWNLVTHLAS